MFELSKSEFIEIAANNFESFGLKMEPVVIHSLANNLYDKASPGDFLRSSSNEVCCKFKVELF